MTSTTAVDNRVVNLARGMRDLVRAEAGEAERNRTLTPPVVAHLWQSGLMQAFNPVEAGGVEPTFAEIIETMSGRAGTTGSAGAGPASVWADPRARSPRRGPPAGSRSARPAPPPRRCRS